jgi:membrane-associated phospholipid phosphatase
VASTVLIHQHYLADLAGGLTLAALASVVSLRLFARDPALSAPASAPAPGAGRAAHR